MTAKSCETAGGTWMGTPSLSTQATYTYNIEASCVNLDGLDAIHTCIENVKDNNKGALASIPADRGGLPYYESLISCGFAIGLTPSQSEQENFWQCVRSKYSELTGATTGSGASGAAGAGAGATGAAKNK